MKRRAALLAFAATATATWLGCTIWNDAMLPDGGVNNVGPGTSSSSSSSGKPGVDSGCARATLETVGPPASAGTSGDIDFVVAVQSISLGLDGNNKAKPDFGYDLDGVCVESCLPRTPDGGAKDGELGRDNGAANMVAGLPIQIPASFANESFKTGGIGILARIRGYNGQANDDDIRFSLYRTTSVDSGPDFTNPDQKWNVDTTDLKNGAGGDFTANTESGGFIKDYKLVVAGLSSSKIPFNTDSDILLNNVSFTGTVFQENGHWNVKDALGVGRWNTLDALQTVGTARPSGDDAPLCKNAIVFGLARGLVCSSADIAEKPQNDNQPGTKCNALSAAVGFTTAPAKIGKAETPTRINPCKDVVIPDCD